jgi:hypothetical protein
MLKLGLESQTPIIRDKIKPCSDGWNVIVRGSAVVSTATVGVPSKEPPCETHGRSDRDGLAPRKLTNDSGAKEAKTSGKTGPFFRLNRISSSRISISRGKVNGPRARQGSRPAG